MMRIGSRRSALAQAQLDEVLARLPPGTATRHLVESEGDARAARPLWQMDRVGAFTGALTALVRSGDLDAAVHSLKDLPVATDPETPLVAILPRADAADVVAYKAEVSDEARPLRLRRGARVGTSSPRRRAQLLAVDPEVVPLDIRGNIETRLGLLDRGLDAVVVAAAAIERLRLAPSPSLRFLRLDPERFPPAPGQGAIAVQARAGSHAQRVLAALDDPVTRQAVEAERHVLLRLGGGCALPLGAYAWIDGDWRMSASYGEGSSSRQARARGPAPLALADEIAATLLRPAPPEALAPLPKVLAITLDPRASLAYERAAAAKGWQVMPWPLLDVVPTRNPMPKVSEVRWIVLTSPHGAPFARQAYASTEDARVAAVGPATARALRDEGLPVHLVPECHDASALAQAIRSYPGERGEILLVNSAIALSQPEESLRADGFRVTRWACYRVKDRSPLPPPPRCDAVVLTSPSNVRAAFRSGWTRLRATRIYAFGPSTHKAIARAGLRVHATLDRPTPAGLAEVLA